MSDSNGMGLFITGTDTGVGKTLVTTGLVRLLRHQLVDAVPFKPVVTGEENGVWPDAQALHAVCDEIEPLDALCPLRFKAPLAPVPSAALDNQDIDLAVARTALDELRARHSVIIVEGIGGLLVPLDGRTLLEDFILEAGYAAVVVARAGLGTINHTLLTLRELDRQRIPVAAIIMNTTRAEDEDNAAISIEEIERHTAHKVTATLPFYEEGAVGSVPPAFASRVAIDLAGQMNIFKMLERTTT